MYSAGGLNRMRPLCMDKPFDLIVYGATGVTGRLIAEYHCL